MAAGILLGLTGLSVAGAVAASAWTLCYAVTDGGTPVAYVRGEESYLQAVERVEEQVSSILHQEYRYESGDLVPALALRGKVQGGDELTVALMDTVEQVRPVWILTVDGTALGACGTQAELNAALEQVKDRWRGENTLSVFFGSEVSVEQDYLPLDAPLLSAQELSRELEGADAAVYTVELETYTAQLSPTVEEVADDTLLEGERRVLREGVPGQEERVDQVVYCRGVETQRETLSAIPISDARPERVAVGTAQGLQGAQGRFAWPCLGSVSSGYGDRDIFGSSDFHRGADIAAPQGSTITAAASGTVIWAGERGTYGNLVKVDHGNGFTTYYAHCSQILVSAGERVEQGQAIALVGATGRATGPHCHFEVLWQGEPIDPLACLP